MFNAYVLSHNDNDGPIRNRMARWIVGIALTIVDTQHMSQCFWAVGLSGHFVSAKEEFDAGVDRSGNNTGSRGEVFWPVIDDILHRQVHQWAQRQFFREDFHTRDHECAAKRVDASVAPHSWSERSVRVNATHWVMGPPSP